MGLQMLANVLFGLHYEFNKDTLILSLMFEIAKSFFTVCSVETVGAWSYSKLAVHLFSM